jgi:hypothetical protein
MKVEYSWPFKPIHLALLSQCIGIVPTNRDRMKIAINASKEESSLVQAILPICGEYQGISGRLELSVA